MAIVKKNHISDSTPIIKFVVVDVGVGDAVDERRCKKIESPWWMLSFDLPLALN